MKGDCAVYGKILFFALLGLLLVCVTISAVLDIKIKRCKEKVNDIQQHRDYFSMKKTALNDEFAALSKFVHMWTDPGVSTDDYYAHLPQIEDAITRMREINSELSFIGDEMQTYLESLRAERKDDE